MSDSNPTHIFAAENLAPFLQQHPGNASVAVLGLLAPIAAGYPVLTFVFKDLSLGANSVGTADSDIVVRSHTYRNDTSQPLNQKETYDESRKTVTSLTWTAGARIQMKLSATILVLSGEFSGEVTFGTSQTTLLERNKHWSQETSFTIPPQTCYRVRTRLTQRTVNSPFVATYEVVLTDLGLKFTNGKPLSDFPGLDRDITARGIASGIVEENLVMNLETV